MRRSALLRRILSGRGDRTPKVWQAKPKPVLKEKETLGVGATVTPVGMAKPKRVLKEMEAYGFTDLKTEAGLLWPWNYEVSARPARMPSGRLWPKISIVTPAFNQGRYLEETIRSVLMQGYPDLEYVVVDGGSSDNTRKILDRYEADLACCIRERDDGQSDALNNGFAHTSGEILAWLNSDDQHLPWTLATVAEAFDRWDTDMIVGGILGIRGFARSPAFSHHCALPANAVIKLPLEQIADFEGEWQKGKFFFQPEVFWRRGIWEATGARVRRDLHFALDYELWLRFAKHGASVVHIPDNLAVFRIHEGQKTKWKQGETYPEHVSVSQEFLRDVSRGVSEGRDAKEELHSEEEVKARIQETIPPDPFQDRPVAIVRTASGSYYLPADAFDDWAVSAIRAGKPADGAVLEVAKRRVRPGTVVLDVGAGFGQTACVLSRAVEPEGQLLAFEADDFVFALLRRNLQANGIENARAFLGAVFDASREQVFFPRNDEYRFPCYANRRVDASGQSGRPSTVITIDGLNIRAPVSLMKVDTQGADLHVLMGAVKTLARHRMPVIFGYDANTAREFGHTWVDYERFAEANGYRIERPVGAMHYLMVPLEDGLGGERPEVSKRANGGQGPQRANPRLTLSPAPFSQKVCKLLKSRSEIEECTAWLKRNGFGSHNLACKDWDLAHILPLVGDGNFLDMGSSDSYILKNVSLMRIEGEKCGIDLQEPDVAVSDVRYLKGDLVSTELPAEHFSYITCLSVLEHQVDFERFAGEVARLLIPGGTLFVTFDYWHPKVTPPTKLYGLEWQPLDRDSLDLFFAICERAGLQQVQDFDWTLGDPVIQWGYYSPHPAVRYTFGLAVLTKQ
ncbi:MAG: FkbM family methyltransferase [Chromatiales bacterium]